MFLCSANVRLLPEAVVELVEPPYRGSVGPWRFCLGWRGGVDPAANGHFNVVR